jgi:hypothetical protein
MTAARPLPGTWRAAIVGTDDRRLRAWYETLPRAAQEAPYSLHDLHDATGIALSRLPALLWRAGWFVDQPPRYPGVRLWHGPISSSEPGTPMARSMGTRAGPL